MPTNHLPDRFLNAIEKGVAWSQTELGERHGMAKQNISALEQGTRGISKAVAHDLAEIFQVSPGRFL